MNNKMVIGNRVPSDQTDTIGDKLERLFSANYNITIGRNEEGSYVAMILHDDHDSELTGTPLVYGDSLEEVIDKVTPLDVLMGQIAGSMGPSCGPNGCD